MIQIDINPNKEQVKEVREALKANDGYCPCKLAHLPENKCPCKDFRDQVNEYTSGYCECQLYHVTIKE